MRFSVERMRRTQVSRCLMRYRIVWINLEGNSCWKTIKWIQMIDNPKIKIILITLQLRDKCQLEILEKVLPGKVDLLQVGWVHLEGQWLQRTNKTLLITSWKTCKTNKKSSLAWKRGNLVLWNKKKPVIGKWAISRMSI